MEMKKLFFLLAIAIFCASCAPNLRVNWEFRNIVETYDHHNKCKIWIDGQEVGESKVSKQTEPNEMKIKVQKGVHDLKILNYALYEGKWEAHVIENDYSIDCIFAEEVEFKKKNKISLIFDLDEGVSSKIE